MPAKKPLTGAAFDGRIATLNRQIATARDEIAEHSLKLVQDPDDKDAHLLMQQIEGEIAGYEGTRSRLEAARAEAERRDGVAGRAEYLAALNAEAEKADALGEEMCDVTERIVRSLESIAPLLARFEELSTERGVLAYGVMRAGSDAAGMSRSEWDGVKGSANLRRGPLSIAVACALYRSGLGRVGPEVKLQVELPPAMPFAHGRAQAGVWRDESSDLCALMREGYQAQKARLTHGLANALEATQHAMEAVQ